MRPAKNDYAPYYETYISKVDFDDPVDAMKKYKEDTIKFFSKLSIEEAISPYSQGKWSYKETLGHIMDAERVMAYRAISIARGETKHLPGFDQELYVKNGNFNGRNLINLLAEFSSIREASIFLFNSFKKDILHRRGIANENEVTVLALGFIISGHNKHHLEILKSFYYKNL